MKSERFMSSARLQFLIYLWSRYCIYIIKLCPLELCSNTLLSCGLCCPDLFKYKKRDKATQHNRFMCRQILNPLVNWILMRGVGHLWLLTSTLTRHLERVLKSNSGQHLRTIYDNTIKYIYCGTHGRYTQPRYFWGHRATTFLRDPTMVDFIVLLKNLQGY